MISKISKVDKTMGKMMGKNSKASSCSFMLGAWCSRASLSSRYFVTALA